MIMYRTIYDVRVRKMDQPICFENQEQQQQSQNGGRDGGGEGIFTPKGEGGLAVRIPMVERYVHTQT